MHFSHLTDLANRYRVGSESDNSLLPGLSIFRRDRVSDVEAAVYDPVVSLILQGRKITSIGNRSVELGPGDALLVSHELPVMSRITRASREEPYLAVILALDLAMLRGLEYRIAAAPAPAATAQALSVGPAEPGWVAPLSRYMEMIDSPLDAEVLGPATLREIHYRLLLAPLGAMLRPLLRADSHASRVARAITRARAEFRTPLTVQELAQTAGMSASSFHKHFKTVTGTTPLQYLKDLRLIEAKALLADRAHSVTQTAFSVGYESPTHFSRDYARKFGLPPSRDTQPTS